MAMDLVYSLMPKNEKIKKKKKISKKDLDEQYYGQSHKPIITEVW